MFLKNLTALLFGRKKIPLTTPAKIVAPGKPEAIKEREAKSSHDQRRRKSSPEKTGQRKERPEERSSAQKSSFGKDGRNRKPSRENQNAEGTDRSRLRHNRSRRSGKSPVPPNHGVQSRKNGPHAPRRSHAASSYPELTPAPPWSPPVDPSAFDNYDLPKELHQGIAEAGFVSCTEVQAKALPLALQGKDIAVQSQTGTGKTATFLITMYSHFLRRKPLRRIGPRGLVISPTRELTVQIENDARILGRHTGLSIALAFGGVDYNKQRDMIRAMPDLLIGTPGRLIDFLKQGVWRPEGVEILVIDEADRMFDMGFIRDLRFILRRLPLYDYRQSMLFSATMSWRVLELTYEYMNLPTQIMVTPEKITAEKAEEVLYHVANDEKPALFLGLLRDEDWARILVFTNMKVEAEKVARLLKQHGFHASAITSNLDQTKRLRLMESFKNGKLPILVATDVASRGLHVEGVTHVVNWDLPQDAEDYVHRIGRTARAGAAGKAITLADEQYVYSLESIETLVGYKIPVIWHTSENLAEVKEGWKRRPAGHGQDRIARKKPPITRDNTHWRK